MDSRRRCFNSPTLPIGWQRLERKASIVKRRKGGHWGGEACFSSRVMGWMKERESVDRSEDGLREIGGVAWVKGVALCAGGRRCLD